MAQEVSEPDLSTQAGRERFLAEASDWEMISGSGQTMDVGPQMRGAVAVFKNGVIVVASGQRHRPQVNAISVRARHFGIARIKMLDAEKDFIEELYKAFGSTKPKTNWRALDLERQKTLSRIIHEAAEMRASDIHMRVLEDYTEIKIRVNGRMMEICQEPSQDGQEMIRAAFAVAQGQGASGTDSTFQQGAMFANSGLLPENVEMLRLQYTPTSEMRGALVMRLKYVSKSYETDVDSLGYSLQQATDLRNMRLKTNGMYIFAGKVSSGKTTTLQRCLNAMFLDKRKEISIYAAEDPKELELLGAIQAQINAGTNAVTAFRDAMKAALRSDPNVIVLGEIRSEELTSMAIEAAKTGHALWSTVHAGSALGILNRLINLGAEREDLKDPRTVGGLIYQRLLGVICQHCRTPLSEALDNEAIDADLAERFARLTGRDMSQLYVLGRGCDKCFKGLTGRTVVAETIRPDARLLEMYMDESRVKAEQYWLTPNEEGGMGGAPVMHHALIKAGAGICDIDEVQGEVDLLETYERELSQLVPRLRRDIDALLAG
jgi:general secretion pathway protein E